jgi:CBS domain-containing protein
MPNRPVSQLVKNQHILSAAATLSVLDAAAAMRDAKVGAIMVMNGSRLVGIFTERDALYRVLAAGKDPRRTTLADVMTVNPATIEADMPFGQALHIMFERGFRHVPVVDEDGQVIGMVSARDALGPEMEQVKAELREREHITEILG